MKRFGQRGFTLIEVLVVCTMLGVLAAIAVPKFTNSIALANTAKLQTDLQTIDAAIVMYETEVGAEPKALTDLAEYITDLGSLKPPNGKCRLRNGKTVEIKDTSYSIKMVKEGKDNTEREQMRAVCDDMTAGSFGK